MKRASRILLFLLIFVGINNGVFAQRKVVFADSVCAPIYKLGDSLLAYSTFYKGKVIGHNEYAVFMECKLNVPGALRTYYNCAEVKGAPLQLNLVYGENLTKTAASELYDKVVKRYQTCTKGNWTDLDTKDTRACMTYLKEVLNLSIKTMLTKDSKNYSVVVELYVE